MQRLFCKIVKVIEYLATVALSVCLSVTMSTMGLEDGGLICLA